MFNKILIANRGEIACRIISTANKLNVKTVAVYSAADENARHVSMADEAVFLGPAAARESYLLIEKFFGGAIDTGAETIQPGYGSFSESADFCYACRAKKNILSGSSLNATEYIGPKTLAKTNYEYHNINFVPGISG